MNAILWTSAGNINLNGWTRKGARRARCRGYIHRRPGVYVKALIDIVKPTATDEEE